MTPLDKPLRRELPDRLYRDKVVTDFSVIERDANVFLVIETIGGCGAALEYVRRALAAGIVGPRRARRNGRAPIGPA